MNVSICYDEREMTNNSTSLVIIKDIVSLVSEKRGSIFFLLIKEMNLAEPRGKGQPYLKSKLKLFKC